VKNVGEGPVQAILEARGAGPGFKSLDDFVRRVDLRRVGRRALESLIKVGALDPLGDRLAMLDALDRLLSVSGQSFRAADTGQLSLFAGGPSGPIETLQLQPSRNPVPQRTVLDWERELLGLYVSDHPLSPYLAQLHSRDHFSAEWGEELSGQSVRVAGLVTHIRGHQTRTGKAMAFVTLDDLQGAIEITVFPNLWNKVKGWLKTDPIHSWRARRNTSAPWRACWPTPSRRTRRADRSGDAVRRPPGAARAGGHASLGSGPSHRTGSGCRRSRK
jgi:DNA polymerase-3 subunit alpha